MKTAFIVFLLALCLASYVLFMSVEERSPFFLLGAGYDVHITNGFTNNSSLPLVIWCSSQEQNLGGRALQEGDDFSWRVKANVWKNSLFVCTMKWDGVRKRFEAFRVHRDGHRCALFKKCFWLVKEDGFYFSGDGVKWKKDFSWS
ncbi:S-protein homolog 5-like [Diospyros lotus]|uniref:S-protein homolog 5-like n=1 Tax=Diospyros lotus TaxID=55363 RepID=UPI0022550E18|nr:S-protein homolog 5-like [Diospyros lotus]